MVFFFKYLKISNYKFQIHFIKNMDAVGETDDSFKSIYDRALKNQMMEIEGLSQTFLISIRNIVENFDR
jgi:hypothetical protein